MSSTVSRIPSDVNQIDEFDTLDDYSLLDILEYLELGDLASFASLSSRVHQIIWDFNLLSKYNIKNATVRIESLTDSKLHATYAPIGQTFAYGNICVGLDCIRATLKLFCSIFDHLLFVVDNDRPTTNQMQELIHDANYYCSTVPQQVIIRNVSDFFEMFTASNATSVTIVYPEKDENLMIDVHFPRLQELSIQINEIFAIKNHLPHLKHFELLDKSCGHFDLRTFAEKNPQITSVKLDLCEGLNNLQEVNEIFPNLESLFYRPKKNTAGLEPVRSGNAVESIRFRNVKRYTVVLLGHHFMLSAEFSIGSLRNYLSELSSIQFDQLESLTYITSASFGSNVQMNFVAQYKHAKCLDYSSYFLTYENVWQLISALPNLAEITFEPDRNAPNHAEFLRLMEETNLEIIRVCINAHLFDEFHELALPVEWILFKEENRTLYTTILTFKRKMSSVGCISDLHHLLVSTKK